MPRKPDIPHAIHEALVCFSRKLSGSPNATPEERMDWYAEVCEGFGKRTADIAWSLLSAQVPQQQVVQLFIGGNVSQSNNPGGANVTQTAGGNMTGVNATGDQRIRDITIYSQDLDQSGAAINAAVKTALVEARRSIETVTMDAAMKLLVIE